MARLCRSTLRFHCLIAAGAVFWNVGVLIGVGAILLVVAPVFNGSSFRVTWPPFCLSLTTLMASWACSCFGIGEGTKFTSRNGICSAHSSVPWLYAAGQLMLFVVPVQGVLQSA